MEEASSSKTLQDFFTKGFHYSNFIIVYLLKNMYNAGTNQRTVSLNTHYNVVFTKSRGVR